MVVLDDHGLNFKIHARVTKALDTIYANEVFRDAQSADAVGIPALSDDPAAAAAIQQHSRTVTITVVDRMIPTSAFGLLSAVLALARHATALLGHSTSNMFRWMLQMSYQATYSNLG